MSQEIYYTSAPEGLRQGQQGFCTVAATEGIGRQLLERLEALSGYRHHFTGSEGTNPVCHAHWLLQVTGKEHHVLSRVCDSGLDYSGRTNALAHHLVLENGEMAPGGPAWMLGRPGLMVQQWDGQVGAITRTTPLPHGDTSGGVCHAWQRLAGDAGWAGVLVEAFIKNPRKPACVLFEPGQDLLPLMTEAIALLPRQLRWGVTFNTYFTSLPGNAICAWRCCIAGTPVAAATMRYAASGVVIDLVRPERMGQPSQSAWVQFARTGTGDPGQAIKPKAPAPSATKPAPAKPKGKATQADLEVEAPAESEIEPPPLVVFDLAPEQPLAQAADLQHLRKAIEAQEHEDQERAELRARPDVSWVQQRRKSRMKRLLMLYLLALAALLAGVWLQVWAYFSSPERAHVPQTPQTMPSAPEVVVTTPQQQEASPVQPTQPVAPPTPTTTAVEQPQTPIAPPPPRPAPKAIKLATSLLPGAAGNGLRDFTQSITLAAEEFDDLAGAAELELVLPSGGSEYVFRQDNISGQMRAQRYDQLDRPGFQLMWHDSSSPQKGVEVLSASLDKTTAQLEVSWRTSLLLRKPAVCSLAYWLMQNSSMSLNDAARQRPQKLLPRPVELEPLRLAKLPTKLGWPCDVPGRIVVRAGEGLPPLWKCSVSAEWRNGDNPNRAPEKAVQVIHFERPTGVAEAKSAFDVRFWPSKKLIDCDLGQRRQADQAELAKWEAEKPKAATAVEKMRQQFQPSIDDLKSKLDDLKKIEALPAEELAQRSHTPASIRQAIQNMNSELGQQQAAMERELAPLIEQQKKVDELVTAWGVAVKSYEELGRIELVVELPDGLKLAELVLEAK